MRVRALVAPLVFVCYAALACKPAAHPGTLPRVDPKLELEKRLETVGFTLLEGDSEALERSYESLHRSTVLPDLWRVEFAGTAVQVPPVDPSKAVAVSHDNGRITAVYFPPSVHMPAYGEIVPIAVGHYMVPEKNLEIVLLLVSFQTDPSGSLSGVGVRSLDPSGMEMSAPFALAAPNEELKGKFFYDEFIGSGEAQAVAARRDWDRGFLLLTKLDSSSVLSTFLPWY